MVAGPEWMAALDSAALLDSVQEAFLAVDSTGLVRGVNRSAQELLGFPAEEICGRHLDDTLHPEHDGPTAPRWPGCSRPPRGARSPGRSGSATATAGGSRSAPRCR
jgi:PAS domain-containing protein